jgi:hypothetical protein
MTLFGSTGAECHRRGEAMNDTNDKSTVSSLGEAAKAARLGLETAAASTTELARRASTTAAQVGADAVAQVKAGLKKVDENHEQIADHADSLAKATRVAAGVAVVGAAVAAPTGLAAVGVAVGVVSAPLIVTAAPILVAVAGGAITVSAAASLYSKARRKKAKSEA